MVNDQRPGPFHGLDAKTLVPYAGSKIQLALHVQHGADAVSAPGGRGSGGAGLAAAAAPSRRPLTLALRQKLGQAGWWSVSRPRLRAWCWWRACCARWSGGRWHSTARWGAPLWCAAHYNPVYPILVLRSPRGTQPARVSWSTRLRH